MKFKELTGGFFIFLLCVQNSCGCPVECNCQGTSVDCSNKGLIAIPNGIEITTTHLDLSFNDITAIGSALSNLLNLESISLRNNSITSIDDQSFVNLSKVTSLDLGSNQINSLTSKAFDAYTELTDLNLENNQIEILPDGLFNKTFKLKILKLSRNRLTDSSLKVINTIFLALLEELDLSANFFPHLPYLGFNNLGSLQQLSFISCSTETIDSNAFIGLPQLQLLDLSLNRMTLFLREMFQNIPMISQLGLYGNPIACSCSIKQVQDFLREKQTVNLLLRTNCSLPNGGHLDIELGELSALCPDPTTPPPGGPDPHQCDENITLSLSVLDVGEDFVELKWDVGDAVLQPGADLHLYARKAIQNEGEDEYHIKMNEPPETPIVLDLDKATPYVACIYELDCNLRSCINFATDGYDDDAAGALSLGAAVGVTCACFGALLIILIVAFAISWSRRGGAVKSHDVEPVIQVPEPEKVHIYLNEDPYEDIPTDAPISKMPKRRNANDALPHPEGSIKLPGATLPGAMLPGATLPGANIPSESSPGKTLGPKHAPQRPVTVGSNTLNTKKDHSPQKPDGIAPGAQTQVFRRPNTMGPHGNLSNVPGLPPKSSAISKSQEIPTLKFSQPDITVVPIPISDARLDARQSRSSNVYIEPDD